jgi:glycosyltransferase involved in cell wall biosynthesis
MSSGDAVALPLVSCVMPTRGRAHWVGRAIRQFLCQDYPNKELIVVYDTDCDVAPRCDDPRVRYLQASGENSIGAKRQQGTVAAAGSIVAQWDDDDWYAPIRLSRQVAPIRLGVAEVTCLTDTLFFDLPRWRFWRCDGTLYARLFHYAVAGGTLVFDKSFWSEAAGYRNLSLREDAEFLDTLILHGARLYRIDGRELFLYLRHGANSWRFDTGRHLEPDGWFEVAEPGFFAADRCHYINLQAALSVGGIYTQLEPSMPLVSCIMPTADRREFVPRAIRLFLAQDYPNKELVIIDDGVDPIGDLIPDLPGIHYHREEPRRTTGAKRNRACALARGEIIAHWDDDDWMSPGWLRRQIETLRSRHGDVCGLSNVLFHDPSSGRAWQYHYDGTRPWVCGGTLCYTRAFWQRNPFPDISVGEDNAFVWSSAPKTLVSHDGIDQYIATIHPGNTSPKHIEDRRWRICPPGLVERILASHGESMPVV